LQNGYYSESFIASSGPQSNKEDEFWEMILIQNCKIVVVMESLVYTLVIRFSSLKYFWIIFSFLVRKMQWLN